MQLNKDTLLLGEDCWADGRYGHYSDNKVMLNDSHTIQELREGNIIGKYQLLDAMQKLADNDAVRLVESQMQTTNYFMASQNFLHMDPKGFIGDPALALSLILTPGESLAGFMQNLFYVGLEVWRII